MPDLLIRPSGPLRGTITIPGDKSITHRGAHARGAGGGDTTVEGWVPAEVCLATMRLHAGAGRQTSKRRAAGLRIRGKGLRGLTAPADVLHCAGSGTTIRLLAGLAAGQPFTSVLDGTEPLRRRPMGRVAEPLAADGRHGRRPRGRPAAAADDHGRQPPGIDYALPVASAQVKSAILLAGLFAEGETVVHEPGPSRDHTERMLRWFGVEVETDGPAVRLRGGQHARRPRPDAARDPRRFLVRGVSARGREHRAPVERDAAERGAEPDTHGAARPAAADGRAWRRRHSTWARADAGDEDDEAGEPVGELAVRAAELHAVEVGGDLVVRAIDEFPIFAVLATQAEGTTVVRDAAELRVKESDRIASVAAELGRWARRSRNGRTGWSCTAR